MGNITFNISSLTIFNFNNITNSTVTLEEEKSKEGLNECLQFLANKYEDTNKQRKSDEEHQ